MPWVIDPERLCLLVNDVFSECSRRWQARTYVQATSTVTVLHKISTGWFSFFCCGHYDDVIMTAIASQITSLTSVYSTVYSDADQRKHQSSASLAFVWGIHRDRWIPCTKGQLRGKCFHLMTSSCYIVVLYDIFTNIFRIALPELGQSITWEVSLKKTPMETLKSLIN